ncbi:DoxX family protein [Actinoalloteichus spitiensis]|uniref:DoxX family protein n=1 Tax=Actinoalloteichus spitiensis TaxID=252394 RepID=UPI000316DE3A|nr:DoxX family protein [Actinoalloteichus spitiensis]
MTLVPALWWLPAALASVLLLDAALSIRPPKFIRDCLDGVGFPREWWWTLIVIKALASAGLIVGIWVPGVGATANAGVVAYFLCASYAHVRARFLRQEFWVNCLGLLAFSVAVFVFSYLV